MGFGAIIIIRLLFAVCMVFIIGYVFGGFSKNPTLATLTKVAAILAIVLFIAANALSMRFAFGKCGPGKWNCTEVSAPKR
ncbi:MAG TPA: hypothetical protein VK541_12920 [Pedobacter sp.]|uniref:hypothetical protein n=1 Tax=Pedobacter sp. TaxID=1411316 RepID=UPI002BDCB683|nr:hypothetical protein [Pedobacter sp.]HMI03384.1 hypothetical protein [Pedobacter sp.]